MAKKFRRFTLTLLCGLLVVGLLCFMVDPFYQYHKPWFGMPVILDNAVYQTPGAARNLEYSDAIIGKGCIINTAASVDHDCVVEDYCHISVGSHLAGTVHTGKHTWIGAGAVVSNNVTVCGECMIGAGAVVVRDINEIGTYAGIPAKRMDTMT